MEQYLRVGCYENIDWKNATETDIAYWDSHGLPPTREEIRMQRRANNEKNFAFGALLLLAGALIYQAVTEVPKPETPSQKMIRQYDNHPRDNRLNSNELEHLLRDIKLKNR